MVHSVVAGGWLMVWRQNDKIDNEVHVAAGTKCRIILCHVVRSVTLWMVHSMEARVGVRGGI